MGKKEVDLKKKRGMTLHEKQLMVLVEEEERIRGELRKMPEGKLRVYRVRGSENYRWYLMNDEGRRYLHRNEHETAEKLALKEFYEARLEQTELR
ncbi:MAG: hypothetical protein K5840_05345, partial [Eubacterium sp.]|nr:hypothetical protein [Eubacterium sp.]